MTAPTGFLGSGDLYMDRLTAAGVSTGKKLVGNATVFSLKSESERKELTGKGKSNYGMVLDSVALQQPGAVEVEINRLDQETLAMVFLGEASVETITGSTVTDEAVSAIHDAFVDLAQRNISSVVVQDETDTTTYAIGTDYELNTDAGMIKVLSTGSITDGQALHVDYAYASAVYDRILGATQPTVKVAMLLDGKNQNTGKDCFVDVWEATLSPDTPVDFLADDFSSVKLTGSMIKPDSKPSPFRVDVKQ